MVVDTRQSSLFIAMLRAAGLVLLVVGALVQVGVSERDSCDVENPTLRRLCRKIESQEKYQEKWVAANFKTETVLFFYFSLLLFCSVP